MPAANERASQIIAGAMSGTSADGVDVAIVRIAGRGLERSVELLGHNALPYAASLRAEIYALRSASTVSLAELARVGREISLAYVRAVRGAADAIGLKTSDFDAIAAHGQTLFHAPPLTVQWLDPSLLAVECDCRVVSDFRRADCALGGQGAPLVPFADLILFRHPARSRLLVNIGGISNFTYLSANATIENVIAFDTGPGNCISDALSRAAQPDGLGIDVDGAIALSGKVDRNVVQSILRNEYFRQPPPKSTDGPAMEKIFREAAGALRDRENLPDALATACALTASAIGDAVRHFLPAAPDDVFVSGGGTHNRAIMKFLRETLGGIELQSTEAIGIPSAAKEAVAFALLGAATLDGGPSNVPAVTGARRPVVLGSITDCRPSRGSGLRSR